ncbi:MAG: 6-carboxytetrahydropterin synthase [Euryarchaeota archaeon]|nr:6-carboxytetrahydropterin synthase [Euryarchaeota archaeon]
MPEIELDGRKTGMNFAYTHMVPGHPKCGRCHGHTGAVIIRFHGPMGNKNMVIDFGVLKAAARRVIEKVDHFTVLGLLQEGLKVRVAAKSVWVSAFPSVDSVGRPTGVPKKYMFPKEDVTILANSTCTAEGLSEWFADQMWQELSAEDLDESCAIQVGWCEGDNIAWSQW